MNDSDIIELRNKAKSKVRTLMGLWTDDWEMKKGMLIISDAFARGVIDKEDVNLVFKRKLIAHIASNEVTTDTIMQSTIFFELLQEVFLEELKSMQN